MFNVGNCVIKSIKTLKINCKIVLNVFKKKSFYVIYFCVKL